MDVIPVNGEDAVMPANGDLALHVEFLPNQSALNLSRKSQRTLYVWVKSVPGTAFDGCSDILLNIDADPCQRCPNLQIFRLTAWIAPSSISYSQTVLYCPLSPDQREVRPSL